MMCFMCLNWKKCLRVPEEQASPHSIEIQEDLTYVDTYPWDQWEKDQKQGDQIL